MKESKELLEFLTKKGCPKYFIADGENGSQTLVIEDNDSISSGITIYTLRETKNTDGSNNFHIGNGFGIREEHLLAIKGFLDQFVPDERHIKIKQGLKDTRFAGNDKVITAFIECLNKWGEAHLFDGGSDFDWRVHYNLHCEDKSYGEHWLVLSAFSSKENVLTISRTK
jgi:hypothetical protein